MKKTNDEEFKKILQNEPSKELNNDNTNTLRQTHKTKPRNDSQSFTFSKQTKYERASFMALRGFSNHLQTIAFRKRAEESFNRDKGQSTSSAEISRAEELRQFNESQIRTKLNKNEEKEFKQLSKELSKATLLAYTNNTSITELFYELKKDIKYFNEKAHILNPQAYNELIKKLKDKLLKIKNYDKTHQKELFESFTPKEKNLLNQIQTKELNNEKSL